ncbi:MAG: hypothetical protein D6738_03590 [Acidobacteria bacterium]|nr:MAG: hypothetical protein D6738_03590 [Acidobacteriota bacterium]
MNDELLVARLRDVLARSTCSSNGEPVPADEILAVLRGERSREDVERLVDRALGNAETEELVRLLPALEKAVDEAVGTSARPRRAGWILGGLAAAAAIVVGVVLIAPRVGEMTAPVEYREGDATALRPLVERGAALDRDHFTLAWSEGPEGSRYDLTVATVELRVLHEAKGLEATEYTVPREALEDLASGETVLWRVDVTLPDGRHVPSGTFRVSVR